MSREDGEVSQLRVTEAGMVQQDFAPSTLADAALAVLTASLPGEKVRLTHQAAAAWREGRIAAIGHCAPPLRPGRPEQPLLLSPRAMAKRGRAVSVKGRVALLHALAHIELNAIDLAWDIIVRFPDEALPKAFYDDWVRVADDEARHFALLERRLGDFDARYGDLPAHDGLWEAALDTAGDLVTRLAVVPMILEARGLDVTPRTIASLSNHGDGESATLLQTILDDEITHVAAGCRWFEFLCARRNIEPVSHWRALIRDNFKGALKPPFNDQDRGRAGLRAAYYQDCAATRKLATDAPTP